MSSSSSSRMFSDRRSVRWAANFKDSAACRDCTIAFVRALVLLVLSAPVWAQPLTVYSDLARIDKSGTVTAPETPREILSPMVIRNGFTSFQLVVQAPPSKHWQLH